MYGKVSFAFFEFSLLRPVGPIELLIHISNWIDDLIFFAKIVNFLVIVIFFRNFGCR